MKREYQYSCDFSFVETSPSTYNVCFSIKTDTGNVIHEEVKQYVPRQAIINDNNDARAKINQWLRAMIKIWYGIGKGVKFTCTNDDSDFLSRADKARETRMKRFSEGATIARPIKVEIPEIEPTIDPARDTRRVYEVVKVRDVWTIVRHEGELLNEQEAKTQLFAHIVNGD